MGIVISGKATAIGVCIESIWGQPPLTTAGGNANTIGVAATNPHRFAKMEPSGGIPAEAAVEVPADELDGGFQPTRGYVTGKVYNGDFSWKMDPENMYLYSLGILGRDVQTTLIAAGSNGGIPVIQHAMSFSRTVPSLTVEEKFSNGSGRVTTGTLVQTIETTMAQNKPIVGKVGLYGKHGVPNVYPNAAGVDTDYLFDSSQHVIPGQMGGDGTKTWATTAAPVYVDVSTGPLVFGSMGVGSQGGQFSNAFITINGTAYVISITEVTTTETREISMHQVGGSGMDIGDCVGNAFTVTGKITALLKDYTPVLAQLNARPIGLNWKFSGPSIGASGVNYSVETWIPKAKLTKAPIPLTAKELMINCEFSAILDPTVGSLIVKTLVNTFDNTALLGTFASSPGGLGGWINA